MNLEQLQRTMAASVMQSLTPDEQMQSHNSAGRSMNEIAGEFIKPNSRLTAFERLEIYNRQYWFRLQSTFAEDFPALSAVIGPKRFEALTNAYLAAHPSRSFSLRNLGSKLHEWLLQNPSYAGHKFQLALDVARVEWACVEAFDNAEFTPLTLHDIATLDSNSRLSIQPHVQLLALAYPADDLVLALHQTQRRESTEAGTRQADAEAAPQQQLSLRKQATWLAIHRADLSVYYKRLSLPEYRTLIELRDGATLPQALDAAFVGLRVASTKRIQLVQQWFTNWAELGWLYIPESKEG